MAIPWYRRSWVIVLTLVLVFPVGIVLMWSRKPGWGARAQWIVTGLVAAVVIVVIAAGASGSPSHNTTVAVATGSPASSVATSETSSPVAASQSPSPAATTASTSAPVAAGCIPDPMAHVYHPDRLHVLGACVTVAGTIDDIRSEADGDYHVLIALDPGQTCGGQDCLNDDNRSLQGGDLVVEAVCEHTVTQTDAISACSTYHNDLVIPARGTHTTATGPWVYDADHGWNEIHPVEQFGDQPAPVATAPATAPPAPAGTLTVQITASQYGYVSAVTSPGAVCTAQAKLPSGRISTAAGLQAQHTAGNDGEVSWTYQTSSSTHPGTGTHTVSCALNGVTASASAPFTVP